VAGSSETARGDCQPGDADLVAFGRHFAANTDLVDLLRRRLFTASARLGIMALPNG